MEVSPPGNCGTSHESLLEPRLKSSAKERLLLLILFSSFFFFLLEEVRTGE